MPNPIKWYFRDVRPLPGHLQVQHEGKEIYVLRSEHTVYGVMWMDVLALNAKDAEKITDDILGHDWHLYESSAVPWSLRNNYKGKEIFVFQSEHALYGLMSLTIIASSEEEARGIIDDIAK
ncbi:hypothetical protein [Paenibacillus ehimensis]|uniref:hypothetical protein n=1 Tax=Paenibacillus ehimensis TaxID=79264 RepID=UPI00046FE7CB|nr:hypothetical protein [Paenibacillus ehimensis]